MTTKDEKLYIVMVGLPSQGKSTIAYRLKDIFTKNDIPTRIFNNGQIRRQYARLKNTWEAEFFNPGNNAAVELRKRFAMININWAKKYVNTKGEVAILDATNVSSDRRRLLIDRLNDHPILFIECINNDEEIVDMSIAMKVKAPEFADVTEEEAVREFKKRIEYYRMIYAPLSDERNFIRMDSLHNRIIDEKLTDQLPLYSRIRDCLVTDVVKSLFL
nr:6-phosphofructo-2-kinase domain-containing protein [Deltaproteobacteria bacterium]